MNFQPAGSGGGENYGWRRMEGTRCYNPGSGCQTGSSLVLPILEYGRGEGCSVTGGYRYRGSQVPSLYGAYVFGDFCSGTMWVGIQEPGGTWDRQEILATALNITSFGEDADGELYVAHIGGTIHRFVPVRPVLRFSTSTYSVKEGSTTATITVQRLEETTGTVTVDYTITAGSATAGADFAGPGGLLTGTLTFLPGQTSQTFAVSIVDDAAAEDLETVTLSLHPPTGGAVLGAQSTATLTITSDDKAGVFRFSKSAHSVGESSPNAELTVRRSKGRAAASVVWSVVPGAVNAAVPGIDFVYPADPQARTLTFDANVTTQSLSVVLLNPGETAPNVPPRTITFVLSSPQPSGLASGNAAVGTPSTSVLTLADDDVGIRFGQATYPVSESRTSVSVTVLRSGPTNQTLVVGYATVGGSATPADSPDACSTGADYRPITGSLTFKPGQTSRTFTVRLCGDSVQEGSESVTLQLSVTPPAQLAGPSTATITIQDND